ncbi:TonB-dependent siderophore receptor, partial [Pseudoalteromonas sp. SIMBA_153]
RGLSITSIPSDGLAPTYDPCFHYGDKLTAPATYDRIELVRGATGLMLGAGNTSAALNLIRKRPTATPQINLTASLGS